jgi:hypothetical protein
MKKNDYRIIEWLHKGHLVYTPQKYHKTWLVFGWSNLLPDTPSGFMLMGWTRGFLETEEEAREVIKGDKKWEEAYVERRKALKEAKAKYKGKRTICVD